MTLLGDIYLSKNQTDSYENDFFPMFLCQKHFWMSLNLDKKYDTITGYSMN